MIDLPFDPIRTAIPLFIGLTLLEIAAGQTAVAKAGGAGVVLFRVGDGFAIRSLPWAQVAGAVARQGRAVIRFGDAGAPAAAFQLPSGAERPPFAEVAA